MTMSCFRPEGGDTRVQVVSPAGVLIQVSPLTTCGDASPDKVRAACLALDPDAAELFRFALKAERLRALEWARARYRRLPIGLRRRLGAMREMRLFRSEGCLSHRSAGLSGGEAHLCVCAAPGGAFLRASAGQAAVFHLSLFPHFVAGAGLGGLGLALLSVRAADATARARCASS